MVDEFHVGITKLHHQAGVLEIPLARLHAGQSAKAHPQVSGSPPRSLFRQRTDARWLYTRTIVNCHPRRELTPNPSKLGERSLPRVSNRVYPFTHPSSCRQNAVRVGSKLSNRRFRTVTFGDEWRCFCGAKWRHGLSPEPSGGCGVSGQRVDEQASRGPGGLSRGWDPGQAITALLATRLACCEPAGGP